MAWWPSGRDKPAPTVRRLTVSRDEEGVCYRPEPAESDWLDRREGFGPDGQTVTFLTQLEEMGFVERRGETAFVTWESLYGAVAEESSSGGAAPNAALALLKLPAMTTLRPALQSQGALDDPDFRITLGAWSDASGRPLATPPELTGSYVRSSHGEGLLAEPVWRLVRAVAEFYRLPPNERGPRRNRLAWAAIRRHALAAGAPLADFLLRTVVLTPDKLNFDLRKCGCGEQQTIEVAPGFEGAPARWLEFFDRLPAVPERYDIPNGPGLVQVVLSPEVRSVLTEVRRWPGRLVSGQRAEAFIRNPHAALGEEAQGVVDAEAFEAARSAAGIGFERFSLSVSRDAGGALVGVALLVESASDSRVGSARHDFSSLEELEKFQRRFETRLRAGFQCCPWQGFELEILGDAEDRLAELRAALAEWRGSAYALSYAEVFDLSRYSDRVSGIGEEKPYVSPYIARKSDGQGWIPENIVLGVSFTPEGGTESLFLSVTEEGLSELGSQILAARRTGESQVEIAGVDRPVALEEAERLWDSLAVAAEDVRASGFKPEKAVPVATVESGATPGLARKSLVLIGNIADVEYREAQQLALRLPPDARVCLPSGLRPEVILKEHQKLGVAWLQHLWRQSPAHCRGALLADDMGLGKTLQILAFLVECFEARPDLEPALIVAPVSLLENWGEEIAKFFQSEAVPLLSLYGAALKEKRLARAALDLRLQDEGMFRFLARGWLGDAKIVLTTYETLRDLEFSLAAQSWSVMVCDEAQRIKNPNALVTRAAKKQKARFRIACTGTPVENSLADLWSLFDFIQPGFLGALNQFSSEYRRPIEAGTDEERERLGELRTLIEPQTLRRTKAQVAHDLPRKIIVPECRDLPLSAYQRRLYSEAVRAFQDGPENGPFKNHLGLIQYLRQLCTAPYPLGQGLDWNESAKEHEAKAPKLKSLFSVLENIRRKGEKAIVFVEFHELQRLLQRFIHERFGVSPDIINGTTSAAASAAASRQKRLRAFQQQPGFGVILLSPLAVGFGVNIQAANHVIHYTRTWNPAKEDQATDRAYRIGQEKDVYVYYPVVTAEFLTFDMKLDQLLEWKRGLSGDMLNGCGDLSGADFLDLQPPGGATLSPAGAE